MSVWTCGQNNNGQLGVDRSESLLPVQLGSSVFLGAIVQVACGDAHCLARDQLGNVYVWGRTREGQACRVDTSPQTEPMLVADSIHDTHSICRPTRSAPIRSDPMPSNLSHSNPVPLAYPISFHPTPSRPNLSHLVPSHPVPSQPLTSHPIPSHPIPSYTFPGERLAPRERVLCHMWVLFVHCPYRC